MSFQHDLYPQPSFQHDVNPQQSNLQKNYHQQTYATQNNQSCHSQGPRIQQNTTGIPPIGATYALQDTNVSVLPLAPEIIEIDALNIGVLDINNSEIPIPEHHDTKIIENWPSPPENSLTEQTFITKQLSPTPFQEINLSEIELHNADTKFLEKVEPVNIFQFTSKLYSVGPNHDHFHVPVIRSSGDAYEVKIYFSVVQGTDVSKTEGKIPAKPEVHYQKPGDDFILFKPGQLTNFIDINLLENSHVSKDLYFQVKLTKAVGVVWGENSEKSELIKIEGNCEARIDLISRMRFAMAGQKRISVPRLKVDGFMGTESSVGIGVFFSWNRQSNVAWYELEYKSDDERRKIRISGEDIGWQLSGATFGKKSHGKWYARLVAYDFSYNREQSEYR